MCRPPRLECKNPRRNATVYHEKRLGFSRDWTVKDVVFRCSSYVALPSIIPHGRGEGELFVYSGYGDVGYSVSQPGSWIQHKRFTGTSSSNGNVVFEGLEYGRYVILCAIPINDLVAIQYYQSPGRKMLGAHIIKDTNTYAAVTNANVTVDVWYYEIP